MINYSSSDMGLPNEPSHCSVYTRNRILLCTVEGASQPPLPHKFGLATLLREGRGGGPHKRGEGRGTKCPFLAPKLTEK